MRAAKTDFTQALSLARGISESWFRCQALAGAARFAPDERVVTIAKESLEAAFSATDSYQKVAVAAWPLRALIERDHATLARQLLPDVLQKAAQIEKFINRSDALFSVWEAFFPVLGHDQILRALSQRCTGRCKADYHFREAILIVASQNIELAHQLASSMPDGKYKRQAQRRLEQGQHFSARSYF